MAAVTLRPAHSRNTPASTPSPTTPRPHALMATPSSGGTSTSLPPTIRFGPSRRLCRFQGSSVRSKPQLLQKTLFFIIWQYTYGDHATPRDEVNYPPFCSKPLCHKWSFQARICCPKQQLLENPFLSQFGDIGVEIIQHPKVRPTICPFAVCHGVKNIHFNLGFVAPSHGFSKKLFFHNLAL